MNAEEKRKMAIAIWKLEKDAKFWNFHLPDFYPQRWINFQKQLILEKYQNNCRRRLNRQRKK